MKAWFYSFILLGGMLNPNSCIDKLQTTDELIDFISTNYPNYNPKGAKKIKVKSTSELSEELNCDGLFSEWDIKNWEKADLNNDGRTDLLVIIDYYGTQTIAILDLAKDTYQFKTIKSSPFDPCQLVKPISINGKTYLKISHSKARSGSSRYLKPTKVVDTLSFFKHYLVEFNDTPSDKGITSIQFETTACFGQCPEFKLELKKDGFADFKGIANTAILGKSRMKLQKDFYKNITDLLNYMDVSQLKSNYNVNWTDDQTGILTVRFDDGSEKKIEDYGMKGSYGLSAVYEELMNLVKSFNTQ